ncbi:MAG: hypothetical protein H7A25_22800 [Leptospiraceae bacterium]|nr:hypothetical protein [Leptospiraceae bacterium]MCP5502746.1 hypothetical protein [Leptospiraceae bacterium]
MLIKEKVPGFLVFGFNRFKPVSISELRNRASRTDASYLYYESKLIDSLAEKDFNLQLFTEIEQKAKNMYELEIGYTTKPDFNRTMFHSFEHIVIQKSDDIVKAYQSAYHFNKHLNYCNERFFNLMKQSAIEYIRNEIIN